MRFLIYLFLAYVAYRVLKSLIRPREQVEVSPGEVIDEMVKCSSCETYVPRREAIRKHVDGRPLNFCCRACADKYGQTGNQSEPG